MRMCLCQVEGVEGARKCRVWRLRCRALVERV